MQGCKTNERRSEVSPGRRARPRLLAGKLISIRPISLLLAVLPLSSEAVLAVSAERAPQNKHSRCQIFFFTSSFIYVRSALVSGVNKRKEKVNDEVGVAWKMNRNVCCYKDSLCICGWNCGRQMQMINLASFGL